MTEQTQAEFLRNRMRELREKNKKSLQDMADLILDKNGNSIEKSTLSRIETGKTPSYAKICEYARKYCEVLHLTPESTEHFLRGEKMVVVDTSALLKNLQLIDELSEEYSQVIIPQIVIDELDNIKDKNTNGLAAKAWQLICSIGNCKNAVTVEYTGDDAEDSNDRRIIDIAEKVSVQHNCAVDIITYDAGFSARLNGHPSVSALFLREYMITKQNMVDMSTLVKIDKYYADSYDDIEAVLGIKLPGVEGINAYLEDGNTLIISAIWQKRVPLHQRIEKIRWLINHGADVNKTDGKNRYFPPLTHAIQSSVTKRPEYKAKCKYEAEKMVEFLLHECSANPNVGSRNLHNASNVQYKNDGNMPLMVAAWHGLDTIVHMLCEDPRTSLNQQDGNGYTALMKACMKGYTKCRDIIRDKGADTKIVDREGRTAENHYTDYLEVNWRNQSRYDGRR